MGRNTSKRKYACKGGQIISSIQVHASSKHNKLNDAKTKQVRVVMLVCLKLWLMQVNKYFDNQSSGTLINALVLLLTPLAKQTTKSVDYCARKYSIKRGVCKPSSTKSEPIKQDEHNQAKNCKLLQSEQNSGANNSNITQEVHLENHKTEGLRTSCEADKTVVYSSSNNRRDNNETPLKTNYATGYNCIFNMKTNIYEFESSGNPAVEECKHRNDTNGSYKVDYVLENDDHSLSKVFKLEWEASNSIYTVLPVFNHGSESTIGAAGETLPTQSFEPLMTIINRIADGERVPPQITMRYEMLRFCTLRSFPRENKPYITRLAEAGFYYANNGDEVVCYCCARRKSNWRETDNPIDVHKQMNPNCSFLLRNFEVNVPIKSQNQRCDADSFQREPSQNNEHNERVSESSTENSQERTRANESSGSSTANVKQSNIIQMQTTYTRQSEMARENSAIGEQFHQADTTDTEGLLHTDAARSVLEMGYHSDIIRKAIRLTTASNDKMKISAVSLMEKIFETEEGDTEQISVPRRIESSNNQQKQAFSEQTSKRDSARMYVHDRKERVEPVDNHDEPFTSCRAAGEETSTSTFKKPPEFSMIQIDEQKNTDSTSENHELSAPPPMLSKLHSSSLFPVTSGLAASEQTSIRKAQLLEQKRLKEENQKLKLQSICTKCRRNDVSIVFLPCGHLVTCEDCAPTVRYCTVDSCGKYIKGTVRTYLA
ncbi:baculoviral IAP repeat-containing protein 3-like [Mercenaria mercenaria]|uniref:baculoviral IAP repeat-containing protein 3-like n=1 Tax=Mercenaria mercenaria TaxID=6596 RepID=UPI00234EF387|nr:baculoviral IAP repeat-containing protein 3-like [Mercenaria mercenaria]